jgi:hypothetical protein
MKKTGIAFRFYESTIEALTQLSEKTLISRTEIIRVMIRKGRHTKSMRHPAPVGKKRMVSFKVSEEDAKMLQVKAAAVHLSSTALLELFVHNLQVKISLEVVK